MAIFRICFRFTPECVCTDMPETNSLNICFCFIVLGIGNKIDTAKQGISGQFTLKKKLYIVVPKDCYARPSFEGLKTVVPLNTAVTDNMTVYRLSDSKVDIKLPLQVTYKQYNTNLRIA